MLQGGWLVNRPDEEIAEPFTGPAIAGVSGELLGEDLEDACFADILRMEPIQPLAVEAAAEIKVVLARRASRQRDLGDVGPRAAVGAAADADRDRLLHEPVPLEDRFDLGEEVGQVALGLGPGERA